MTSPMLVSDGDGGGFSDDTLVFILAGPDPGARPVHPQTPPPPPPPWML